MKSLFLSAFADEVSQDLSTQIAALKNNGIRGIDLRAVNNVNVADFTSEMIRQIREALQQNNISVACLASPVGKTDITDSISIDVEKLKRLCATAHTFDCSKIRMFSFYLPQNMPAEQFRQEVFERLNQLLEIAEQEGVRLLHENEKGIYGDTLARCADLHQTFGSRLGGILDPANYLQVGDDPLLAMNKLDQWIEYLHIKDCRKSDGKIVAAGLGDGQIDKILALYMARPDRRNIGIEPHLYFFDGLAKLEKDVVSHTETVQETAETAEQAFARGIRAVKTILAELG